MKNPRSPAGIVFQSLIAFLVVLIPGIIFLSFAGALFGMILLVMIYTMGIISVSMPAWAIVLLATIVHVSIIGKPMPIPQSRFRQLQPTTHTAIRTAPRSMKTAKRKIATRKRHKRGG